MLILVSALGCGPAASDVLTTTGNGMPAHVGEPLAGMEIDKVVLYQGPATTLMDDFERPKGELPVVIGRDGLVRVFVRPQDAWESRDVQVLLSVQSAAAGLQVFESWQVLGDASKPGKMETTVNFEVPGELLEADTVFTVSLHEGAPSGQGAGTADKFYWSSDPSDPAIQFEGTAPVELVILPIRYNADGSGRLPNTSDVSIQKIHDRIMAHYPLTDLTVTVEPPVDWSFPINSDGSGWETLLGDMAIRRTIAAVPENTYYYALFQPDESIESYCSRGCVLGLSLLGGVNDVWSRASIGLGFNGDTTSETLVHEVGHAHGREHAPCGLFGQPFDNAFPYSDGDIGVYGYDIVQRELKSPSSDSDMMSYCMPQFVSDYTYDALLKRIQALADARRSATGPTTAWRVAMVDPEGTTTLGPVLDLASPPTGSERSVRVLDADGLAIGRRTARFAPTSHMSGGMLFFPDVPGATDVEL
jgi:hypothetical protein